MVDRCMNAYEIPVPNGLAGVVRQEMDALLSPLEQRIARDLYQLAVTAFESFRIDAWRMNIV